MGRLSYSWCWCVWDSSKSRVTSLQEWGKG